MKNKDFKEAQKRLSKLSLSELLDEISVMDEWENKTENFDGWFAVCNDLGIIGYFSSEGEAFGYRLDYINRILNS